jgi:hypothetical protein
LRNNVTELLLKFSDLSLPTVPSLDEQRDALRKGLGRAMQWALGGQLADEPLLEACLQDQRFDRETADPRGEWLWQMIQVIGAADRFREPILQALHQLSDEDSAHQLCQLARHFAQTGDETFRKRLYEIVEQKPIKDMPWLGEEEFVALDGEAAFVSAARLRGQELPTRDWEWHDDCLVDIGIECLGEDRVTHLISDSSDEAIRRFYQGWLREEKRCAERVPAPSRREIARAISVDEILAAAQSDNAPFRFGRFRTWGMYADEADLEPVLQQLWTTDSVHVLANLLSVFSNRALPEFDARLIDFCEHEDADVRRRAFGALGMNKHPSIRRFALEQLETSVSDGAIISLFANNCEPGDEHRILESLELPPDENDLHGLLMDVNIVLEKNPDAECSKLAVIVYALTPCENCRFAAMRLLHGRRVMPEWIREECRYDSGKDCRQLVSNMPGCSLLGEHRGSD